MIDLTDRASLIRATGGIPDPTAPRPAWMQPAGIPLTGKGVLVAVIDSGWNEVLDDDRVLPGAGLVSAEAGGTWASDVADTHLHGSRCTRSVLHVAPGARVIPFKIFNDKLETTPGIVTMAVERALAAGVRVINLSVGARAEHASPPLYEACQRARDAGVIVVAATRKETPIVPAAFDNVLSVASRWFPTPFHHQYDGSGFVECFASGRTHDPTDEATRRNSGSPSYAAPRVTGMVALLLERWPALDLDSVRAKLAQYSADAPALPTPLPHSVRTSLLGGE
jgi:subtilisin family serine protease